MGLDLVKHDMGGGDIQNKHRIFAGLARDHAGFCKNVFTRIGTRHLRGRRGQTAFM